MKKKPTKKFVPTPEFDSTREQNVLLEKIYSEVKTVGEGHSVLKQETDKINNKLVEHDKRFDMLETAITEVGTKVKENTQDIKELKTKVGRIEQKLDTVITDHEQRISKLEAIR